MGHCSHMLVRPDKVLYRVCNEEDLDDILYEHIIHGRIVDRLKVTGKTIGRKFFEIYGDVAFFNRQSRVALRHNGIIDPESLDDFFHYRGFQAMANVLAKGRLAVGDRRGDPVEAARPRRRRLSDRAEVGDGFQGGRANALPHL